MALMKFREPNQAAWVGFRPGHRGTQVTKHAAATNTTLIIHTVTSGKVLYMTSFFLSVRSGVGEGILFVRDTSDVLQYHIVRVELFTKVSSGPGVGLSLHHPIEIPAGFDVCVQSTPAFCIANGFINGWEE